MSCNIGSEPHDGITPCPPESRCSECWPEAKPVHTGVTSVWKFPLSDSGAQIITNMPRGAEILRLALQNGAPTIWARVKPDAPPVARTFQVFGTGFPITGNWAYVGTFDQSLFVWHVFELLTDEAAR